MPQALIRPELMTPVGTLPLAVLFGHLPPRRSGPGHPQDATEHSAVVERWSAYLAALRRQQGTHQSPLLVGEVRLFGRDRGDLGRPFSDWRVSLRAPYGPAASRHRLVSSPPQRPSQQEAPSPFGLGHSEHQAAHLGHRRRDHTRVETPFLGLSSSSMAALWRVTTRKAWASRLRVMWRCHESHLLTS